MSTLTTLIVVGTSLWLGTYLARKAVESNHALIGAMPHLSIIGLIVLALTISHDNILFTGACIISATLCATIWSEYWQEQKTRRSESIRRLQPPSQDYNFGPQDDFFRRNENSFFGPPARSGPKHSSPADSAQKQIERPRTFTKIAPGVRRTANGVIIRLVVTNRLSIVSKDKSKVSLRLI